MPTEFQRETLQGKSDSELADLYVRFVANARESWSGEKDFWVKAVHDCWAEVERRGLGPRVIETLKAQRGHHA